MTQNLRKARSLPVHQGPAAWSAILGPGAAYPTLESDITADVVVIGAGFAGLSAAQRLGQIDPKLRVVVLEAGDIAEGAAGRNSGFMIDIPHELASDDYAGAGNESELIALNRKAQAFGASAVEEYEIPAAYFQKSGKINGAATDRGDWCNSSLARHLGTLGEASEHLDATQMAEITGSNYYRSGLFTPGTVMLQPAGYVRGLAAGLQKGGVGIHTRSPVTGLTPQGDGWVVSTPKAKLTANRVILTTNGHLESFGFARGRLIQLFLFASMTPELTDDQMRAVGGCDTWGVTPSDPMGTTMRRISIAQGGNRIITRTCAALRPGMRATRGDLKRAATVMQRKFDNRFPQLSGLKMDYTWSGHLCLSQNGVSVARELEPGLFSGCVQNGLGTARGTLTGIAAAEACMGQDSDITQFFDRQDPPSALPPKLLQTIGGNTLLRWKEWRASDE